MEERVMQNATYIQCLLIYPTCCYKKERINKTAPKKFVNHNRYFYIGNDT